MKKIFIDCRPDEVRTALIENGKLCELFIDKNSSVGSWVGRVIVGRVATILPGQFSFVDIGASKNAFMNLEPGHGLKAGQPVLVQVYKDATRTKGMYVKREICLKGRLIVLHESPDSELGVSRKITDEKEAKRLRRMVRGLLPSGFGAIVRTNAAGQTREAIAEEISQLHELYTQLQTRAQYSRPPAVLYPDSENSPAILKDIISDDIDEIHISGEEFVAMKEAVCALLPTVEGRIFHYEPGNASLFDAHGITRQISAALKKIVDLPCGGFVTFEETEACVVIDVNTGSNISKLNYREAVLETNLEAAKCIAWEITLRNLSGIILVDFIDMKSDIDKATLLETLAKEFSTERLRPEIVGMIGLGMVQLTRRKTRPSLGQLLQISCPRCGGRGRI